MSLKWLKSLDMFNKVQDTTLKTSTSGGFVTLLVSFAMLTLLFYEVKTAVTINKRYSYVVDPSIARTFQINLDITLASECKNLKVEVLDSARAVAPLYNTLTMKNEPLVLHSLSEVNLAKSIRQLIREAGSHQPSYHSGAIITEKGCRISGVIHATKLQGAIQITANDFHGHFMNYTHQIDRLSFGQEFPGIVNPLDYTFEVARSPFMMFQYFLSLVPTVYTDLEGNMLVTNQYAMTEHKRAIDHDAGSHGTPGIFFQYDIEPILVSIKETKQSLMHSVTRICGLIGGLFVTVGLLAHSLLAITQLCNAFAFPPR